MKELLVKEFRQGWRSFKIPAFFLVLLFFALLDPPTTKYMGEIMQWFAHDLEIILPEPTSQQAFLAFLSSVSQIGFFVLILISMGIVSSEKSSGVAAWILTQPIRRRDYLLAKLLVLALTIIGGIMVAGLFAYLYSWSLLGPLPLSPALYSLLGLSLYGIFLFTVTFFGSILLSSSWGAGILAFGVMAGSSLLHLLESRIEVVNYLPYGFVAGSQEAFLGVDKGFFLGQLLVTLLLIGGLFLFSIRCFSREELG